MPRGRRLPCERLFLGLHHVTRWPATRPVRDAIHPDVGLRMDLSSVVANGDSLGPATGPAFAFHENAR